MPTAAQRICAAFPDKSAVRAASRERAIAYLDCLKETISQMDPFEEFPEGACGVVLYAMLWTDPTPYPDIGDYHLEVEEYQRVLEAAGYDIYKDFSPFAGSMTALLTSLPVSMGEERWETVPQDRRNALVTEFSRCKRLREHETALRYMVAFANEFGGGAEFWRQAEEMATALELEEGWRSGPTLGAGE